MPAHAKWKPGRGFVDPRPGGTCTQYIYIQTLVAAVHTVIEIPPTDSKCNPATDNGIFELDGRYYEEVFFKAWELGVGMPPAYWLGWCEAVHKQPHAFHPTNIDLSGHLCHVYRVSAIAGPPAQ